MFDLAHHIFHFLVRNIRSDFVCLSAKPRLPHVGVVFSSFFFLMYFQYIFYLACGRFSAFKVAVFAGRWTQDLLIGASFSRGKSHFWDTFDENAYKIRNRFCLFMVDGLINILHVIVAQMLRKRWFNVENYRSHNLWFERRFIRG